MSKSGGRKGRRPATDTGVSFGSTGSVSQLLPLAVHQHQQGHFDRARVLYEEILEIDPRHADGLQYYGILCHQLGDAERAETLIRQAIEINPQVAPYYDNLGSVLEARDEFAQALEAYDQAEALEPGDPDRAYNRGVALQWLGRFDEALESFQAALEARPEDAECHFCLGNVYKARGQLDQARPAYERALELDPRHLGARNNLGNVLQFSGQLAEAEDCFRRLLVEHPENVQAHHNLASVLNQQGRVADALVHFNKALKSDPEFSEARLGMARAMEVLGDFQAALEQYLRLLDDGDQAHESLQGLLRIARFHSPPGYDPAFCDHILQAIESGQATADALARALARQWLLKARLSRESLDYDGQVLQFAIDAGDDPLLLTLLRSAVNTEPLLENWLRCLRRILLFSHEGLESLLALQAALAIQCFHNDYVMEPGEVELARLEEVESALTAAFDGTGTLEAGGPLSWDLLHLASYRPLSRLDYAPALAAFADWDWPAAWRELLEVSVCQPLEEQALVQEIRTLGNIQDPVSVKVKAQYEEHPYPRWMALPQPREGALSGLMASVLGPDARIVPGLLNPRRILSAGCGTGQEALALAALEPRAKVTGLDLSAASLAYGQRMARSLEYNNIEFVLGDILELPSRHQRLDGPFDFIAASGVLHHMHSPGDGWEALVQVLRPGGVMKVALYSIQAREVITLAHERIRELQLTSVADDIRSFRRRILEEREPGLRSLLDSGDFYTTSSCRDLLFHAMEHSFDIPGIRKLLAQLNLEFLGFELAHPRIRQDFIRRYPRQLQDLEAWAAYERENPQTFEAMYVIWCRKAAMAH